MSTSFLQRARAVGGLLLVLTAGVGAHDVGRQKAEHAVEKTVVSGTTVSGVYKCYDVVKDPLFGWVVTW